ncbi:MAG: sigma-54 dependent transcriptional regulator [Planctomycetota bacterium]
MLARVILAVKANRLQRKFCALLQDSDVVVDTVQQGKLLWETMANENADLIIISGDLIPGPAAETIRSFRELPDSPDVVVVSAGKDAQEQADLLAAGCRAVLDPGLPPDSLREVLEAVVRERHARALKGLLPREPLADPRLGDFVSDSTTMQAFMQTVRRVVPSNTSLLILGETGVGKERLAMAIHGEGRRSEGPFVAVNCGALPETLLESELFGHEEGAFTGATRARRGMFELAHRGTIFLDEVGEMPLHLQVRLLRVLQEHKIQRLGSERSIEVEVRVIAASNRDVEAEVETRRFRKDLYYRLSVVTLTIPPLRERREDIPALVQNYMEYLRPQVGRDVTRIADEALHALTEYAWPGNVRELINVIERAMLLCDKDTITLNDLPQTISSLVRLTRLAASPLFAIISDRGVSEKWLRGPIREGREKVVAEFERAYLAALLSETRGRVGDTAKRAGIEPRSLYDKMKKYGLRKEGFKSRE